MQSSALALRSQVGKVNVPNSVACLSWSPTLGWYMHLCSFKNRYQKDTC